jgi:hypothetical protein
MQPLPPTAPETVFERTPAGQREAVDDRLGLSAADRRILLLVNGFTPFSELAARMRDVVNVGSRALDLMEDGLIAQVEMAHPDSLPALLRAGE